MRLSTRRPRPLVRTAAPLVLILTAWGGVMFSPAAAEDTALAPSNQPPATDDSSAITPGPSVDAADFIGQRMRGLVMPSKQVVVGAPLDGQLAEVAVDDGDRVETDQVLAVMDEDVQRVVVGVAEMEIEQRELQLAEGELQLERITELERENAAQEWEVRRARLSRDSARIQRDSAKENLRLEQVRLEEYQLLAPFDGRVVQVDTDAGTSLRHSEPILSMVALDPLEAELYLPVDVYGKLEIGRTYQLDVDPSFRDVAEQLTGEKTLEGRLKSVDPLVNSAADNFRCVFTIDNPDEKLPAGFIVRLVWDGE